MKTQVIQLDCSDDVISAKDKLLWSKSPRIVLVFPSHCEYRIRYVDLNILNRQALRQGSQLAIVTKNTEAIEWAEAIGVSVFSSILDANKKRWKRSRLRFENSEKPIRSKSVDRLENIRLYHYPKTKRLPALIRVLFFFLGCISFITIILPFLPKASIYITTNVIQQELDFEIAGVLIDESESSSTFGKIRIYESETIIARDGQIPSSGFKLLPKSRAVGRAVVTNLSSQMVEIPEGTIFATFGAEKVRFTTSKSVVLPAGVSQQIEIPVEAVEPGITGNISPGELLAVEGELGAMISVQNVESFSGGAMERVLSPTQADYVELKSKLAGEMMIEAINDFTNRKEAENIYFPITTALETELMEEKFPAIGQPGDHLQVRLQNEYSCWFLAEAEIQQMAKLFLDANLLEDYAPQSEIISIEFMGEPIIRDEGVTWRIKASRMISKLVDEDEIASMIAGRDIQLAERLILTLLEAESQAEIDLFPEWWRYLPIFSSRITLVVNQ